MTPETMAAECRFAMTQPGCTGVNFTIPVGKMPKGFPRGELLNEMYRNGQVERTYHFNPAKVLVWLAKQNGPDGRRL